MNPLRTAVMGLSEQGEALLAAASADDRFVLCALADPDPVRLAAACDRRSLPGFGDFRSLIVETARDGLDLLLVGAEPHESAEFLPLAARHGAAVLHKCPFARTVGEGKRAVDAFAAAGKPLWVTRPWAFERAFAGLLSAASPPFSATISLRAPAVDLAGWRGDSNRAGGGVLLSDAAEQVDLLASLLGPAEQVSAMTAFAIRSAAARSYDTEDAAVAILHFSGGRVGAINAVRGPGTGEWRGVIVGAGVEFEVLPGRMRTLASGGRPRTTIVRTQNRFAAQLAAVGDYLLGRTVVLPPSTGEEHLTALAMIEAAYLSARTGSPESPERMLRP